MSTKLEIISKVELDLDLQEESFCTPAEMTGYLNDAVRDARAIISNIEEDYFLASANLPLVLGSDEIVLPADIYASKIRSIIYNEGGTGGRYYEVARIRNFHKFLRQVELARDSTNESDYRYFLTDLSAASGVKVKLTPASRITNSSYMTVWYLRDAAVLSADSDVCDIPEFINFIYAHMKRSCLTKMNNGIAPPEAQAVVSLEEKRMVETLSQMTPDNDDEIQSDLSHYQEHT